MEAFAVLAAITLAMEARLEAELGRFPPPDVVKVSVEFYVSHALWLASENDSNPGIKDRRNEVYTYGLTWRLLARLQNATRPLDERLANFKMFKKLLGPEAYNRGQMPLPPFHRFKEGRPSQMDMHYLSTIRNLYARTLSVVS